MIISQIEYPTKVLVHKFYFYFFRNAPGPSIEGVS